MNKDELSNRIKELKQEQKAIHDNAVEERKERSYLKISELSGKLSGIPSITTTCCCNPYCIARAKDKKTICSKCYAANPWPSNLQAWSKNYTKLQHVIPLEKLPLVNALFFRFESHGDLGSIEHAMNYINICRINPRTTFALWTKNYSLIKEAIRILGKPENLILIVSSPFTNYQLDIKNYPLADKIFTVYSPKYAAEHGIQITCGGSSCRTCLKCYLFNKDIYISELVK